MALKIMSLDLNSTEKVGYSKLKLPSISKKEWWLYRICYI